MTTRSPSECNAQRVHLRSVQNPYDIPFIRVALNRDPPNPQFNPGYYKSPYNQPGWFLTIIDIEDRLKFQPQRGGVFLVYQYLDVPLEVRKWLVKGL